MTTIIIMLVLMLGPYAAARALSAVTGREIDLHRAAALGLALLFAFTGIGHFLQTEPMAQMLPPWIPGRTFLVYATGVLEFAIAVGFFMPSTRRLTGWSAAAALVLFFPANIYAAFHHVPMGGHVEGPAYLLIRAPLQLIILYWVYWFAIRPRASMLGVSTRVQE
jgi:uncharacterized membrane protein